MRAAQAEEGCVFMHLLQRGVDGTEDEPGSWTVVEQVDSRAAWDEHMASEHNQRGNAGLEPLLRAPSTLRLLHEVVP